MDWDRFSDSISYNLHQQLPVPLDTNNAKVDLKKNAYKEYTLKEGNCGTITELSLMAEMFGFVCCAVRKVDDNNFNCYGIGVSDIAEVNDSKPILFLIFTGPTSGHFRYLHPIKPKKPSVIQSGRYTLSTADSNVNHSSINSITNHVIVPTDSSQTVSNMMFPCPHCPIDDKKFCKSDTSQ